MPSNSRLVHHFTDKWQIRINGKPFRIEIHHTFEQLQMDILHNTVTSLSPKHPKLQTRQLTLTSTPPLYIFVMWTNTISPQKRKQNKMNQIAQ